MTRLKRFLALTTIVLSISGFIAWYRFVSTYQPQSGRLDPSDAVSMQFDNAQLIQRVKGRPEWSVKSSVVKLIRSENGGLEDFRSLELEGIGGGVIYRNGIKEARFTAKSASYEPMKKNLNIVGPIEIHTAHKEKLNADRCRYSLLEDAITLDSGARLSVSGATVLAPYAVFMPKAERLDCSRGAEMKMDNRTFTTERLLLDLKGKRLSCSGRSTMRDATGFAESHQLDAELESVTTRSKSSKQLQVKTVTTGAGFGEFRVSEEKGLQ